MKCGRRPTKQLHEHKSHRQPMCYHYHGIDWLVSNASIHIQHRLKPPTLYSVIHIGSRFTCREPIPKASNLLLFLPLQLKIFCLNIAKLLLSDPTFNISAHNPMFKSSSHRSGSLKCSFEWRQHQVDTTILGPERVEAITCRASSIPKSNF